MNLWNKTRGFFVKTCNILIKNKNAVCAAFVTLILCMLWIFSIQIKTSSALLKSHNEKKIILNESNQVVGEANKALESQNELIKLQRIILDKQKQESDQIKKVLKMQYDMIQKLIQHLKNLDEWPPRVPYDPDSIA